MDVTLPQGAQVRSLVPHPDRRGRFTELYRDDWGLGIGLRQWSWIVTTQGNVLRGTKVHLQNDHYVVVTAGRATFGLRDLRPGSPTQGLAIALELDADPLRGLVVPRGVAHGFYLHEPGTILIADTLPYDPQDHYRVDWRDLGIPWPSEDPIQTDEDAAAPPLRDVLPGIEAALTS